MGGMGGMGGGMFNLPPDLLPNVPRDGFNAFSVTRLMPPQGRDRRSAQAGEVVPRRGRQPAGQDRCQIEKGAKPDVVWDRYFAKNDPKPAAVRDAVRRLMNQQKFDQ